jgi:hypothetical protein
MPWAAHARVSEYTKVAGPPISGGNLHTISGIGQTHVRQRILQSLEPGAALPLFDTGERTVIYIQLELQEVLIMLPVVI